MHKIVFDRIFALLLLFLLSPLFIVISILIKISSAGPIIHCSKRIGRNNIPFVMYKFRTMYLSTPELATHLLENPHYFITPLGKYLRKYSLDELPQLLNILKGDMSFVGPRPALFNQHDLISLRTKKNIHQLRPGLTGPAQINGRDELSIEEKVSWDGVYLRKKNSWYDFYIILKTLQVSFLGRGIKH